MPFSLLQATFAPFDRFLFLYGPFACIVYLANKVVSL